MDAYHTYMRFPKPECNRVFYVVCSAADGDDDAAFEGFVKTIKNCVRKYSFKQIDAAKKEF